MEVVCGILLKVNTHINKTVKEFDAKAYEHPVIKLTGNPDETMNVTFQYGLALSSTVGQVSSTFLDLICDHFGN